MDDRATRVAIYSGGPLPIASEFAEYERVHPGTAGELHAMAKAEMEHRHKREDEELELERERIRKDDSEIRAAAGLGDASVKISTRGQVPTVVILLALIGGAVVCAINDVDWLAVCLFAAFAVFSAPVVASGFRRKIFFRK